MTASLYQRSEVVLKIPLRPDSSADAENVRRNHVRIQLHEISRTVPRVPRAAEKIVNLKRAIGVELQSGEVELDPARLCVVRVDVDRAENHVVACRLAVAEDRVVFALVKAER